MQARPLGDAESPYVFSDGVAEVTVFKRFLSEREDAKPFALGSRVQSFIQ